MWAAVAWFCWMAVLLRATPAWRRALNRGGAGLGRAVAWFCSGGPGWALARHQLEISRASDRMAALMLDMATWRSAPASRSRGLAQHVDLTNRRRW